MELFFRGRMAEGQRKGMKCLPGQKLRPAVAVEGISRDGMPKVRQMDPDLVGPSRFQSQAKERIAPFSNAL